MSSVNVCNRALVTLQSSIAVAAAAAITKSHGRLFSARALIAREFRTLSAASQRAAKPTCNVPTTATIPTAIKLSLKQRRQLSDNAVGVASACGRRTTNEDRTLIKKLQNSDLTVIGLFDGHGGHEAADYVRDCLPTALTQWLIQNGGDMERALSDAFIHVNDQFTQLVGHRMSNATDGLLTRCCGTTATVCLLRRDVITNDVIELVFGHVGDTRAMMCSSDNVIIQLTTDHHADVPAELNRISCAGGHVKYDSTGKGRVNGILEMTRSLGDIRLKQYGVSAKPDVKIVTINPSSDRHLILTTDGVHSVLNPVHMSNIVATSIHCQEAANRLVDEALLYGSDDNCTVIVLPLTEPSCEKAASQNETQFVQFGRLPFFC